MAKQTPEEMKAMLEASMTRNPEKLGFQDEKEAERFKKVCYTLAPCNCFEILKKRKSISTNHHRHLRTQSS